MTKHIQPADYNQKAQKRLHYVVIQRTKKEIEFLKKELGE